MQPEDAVEITRPEITLEKYRMATLPDASAMSELRNAAPQRLLSHVVAIAEIEGPVHREVVVERIRQGYEIGRVRGSTRDNVEEAIQSAIVKGMVRKSGNFIWSRDAQLQRPPRIPVDGNVEHIAPTELEVVTIAVAGAMFGIPRADLIVEVARRLGFSRTGGRITEVLEDTISRLLDSGRLAESFEMVHVPKPKSGGDADVGRHQDKPPEERPQQIKAEEPTTRTTVVELLRNRGLQAIDKRPNGSLWVIGGPELKQVLSQFAANGVHFSFAKDGGQSTAHRPAWWTHDPG
jgi:hypothetical protein